MLQINQFIDHDDRVVTAVGVTITLYTDCAPEADEHVHRVYDVDGNERWWITPVDIVRGLRDGSYTLTYCGDGTQTERAKMYEQMKETAFDDDAPELFGAVFDDMDIMRNYA